jgi:predicted ribosomally synthesized peptide with SipW-like signal peptide
MNYKKLYLPIAIFLALSVLGVSMAYWTDVLTVNAEIRTGTLEAVWSNPTFLEIIEEEWKEVAYCEAIFEEKVLTITVTNAYPGYICGIDAGIHYQGTVPAHIKNVTITAPPELEVWITPIHIVNGTLVFSDMQEMYGYQLHYLEEYFMYIWVEVIEIDGPDIWIDPMQDTTYEFTIEIELVQYNDPSQLV